MAGNSSAESEAHLSAIVESVGAVWSDVIAPLGKRFSFEPGPSPGEVAGPPTVLFIGNHSSGKSTFINFMLGEAVEKAGLAPTDDSFTVICHGATRSERDGRALTSDPDAAWDGLAAFGPALLSHLREKRRPIDLLRRVTLIDTPGMIDAAREDSGRGYDFTGAVRWFAERADLILLFFDPDKPGTTGETLDVYTRALVDLDHKLRVVLNKVDRFGSMSDFARAYGSLCWNLARVSPRKDLPLIYTTFVPVRDAPRPALPDSDFVASRGELAAAIRNAPAARAHNLVSRLLEHGERLRMHARVVDQAARDMADARSQGWAALLLLLVLGVGLTAATVRLGLDWWLPVAVGATVGLGLLGGHAWLQSSLRKRWESVTRGIDAVFERAFATELLVREQADDLHARWESLRDRTRRTVAALGPGELPRLGRRDHKKLDAIAGDTVPELRRRIAEIEPASAG